MKKQLLCSLMISGFLFASVASATHDHEKHHIKPPDESVSAILYLTGGLLASSAVHYTSGAIGADVTTQALFHAANGFLQLGLIADSKILRSFSLQTLLAGGAAWFVTGSLVRGSVGKENFLGKSLIAAGEKGTGVMTVATWAVLNYGYQAACDFAGYGSK